MNAKELLKILKANGFEKCLKKVHISNYQMENGLL